MLTYPLSALQHFSEMICHGNAQDRSTARATVTARERDMTKTRARGRDMTQTRVREIASQSPDIYKRQFSLSPSNPIHQRNTQSPYSCLTPPPSSTHTHAKTSRSAATTRSLPLSTRNSVGGGGRNADKEVGWAGGGGLKMSVKSNKGAAGASVGAGGVAGGVAGAVAGGVAGGSKVERRAFRAKFWNS